MDLFLLLLFLLLVIFSFLSKSSNFKGYLGERKVNSKIESLIRSNNEYRSFHDLTLQTPDGTTQIDHVLLSPYGIFVIETKNYKGWIFGSADQKNWTQTIYKKKHNFQNPLRQNYKHIKAVQNLLNVDLNTIVSVVVFVGNSEFKTSMPYNVIELRGVLPFLKSHTQQILSSVNVDKYTQILSDPVHNAPTNQRDHVNNVKQNKINPICPKCGKPMVLRTARKGGSAGNKFWGCSGFPACKVTKIVN